MSETQRLFVALPIPKELQDAAARIQSKLNRTGADVSYPRPENVHFTLVFLGDTFPDAIPALQAGLDRVAGGAERFRCQVSGLGFFGPPRRPRVVWVGVTDPPEVLFELQRSIRAVVAGIGLPCEERAWSPHLTLGRIRSGRGLDALSAAVDALKDASLGACPVEEVHLVRSRLDQPGPCYEILHRARLV